MKQDKLVLKVEADMQNIEQVKELLPQIATLQKKYDVRLTIKMYPCASNLLDVLARHLHSKEQEISDTTTDTHKTAEIH